jgi:hypothetical protein
MRQENPKVLLGQLRGATKEADGFSPASVRAGGRGGVKPSVRQAWGPRQGGNATRLLDAKLGSANLPIN